MNNNPYLPNALQLRQLTDFAASLRGSSDEPIYVVGRNKEDGSLGLSCTRKALRWSHEDVVVRTATNAVAPARPVLSSMSVGVDGPVVHGDMAAKYDAIFWSEAAVEKFVIPYYAAKSMWRAAHVIRQLSEQWYGYVPAPPDPLHASARGDVGDVPFALAHVPGSDYVPVGDEVAGKAPRPDDLHLLFSDGNGEWYHRSLLEAAERPVAAPAEEEAR